MNAPIGPAPLAAVPDGWLPKPPVMRLRFSSIGAIVAGGLLLYADFSSPTADAPSVFPIVLMAAGLLGLFLSTPRPRSRRAPRLASSRDFTDSSAAPSESWVHFSPSRAVRWPVVVAFIVAGLAALTLAIVFVVMPPQHNSESTRQLWQFGLWVAAFVLAAGAMFFFRAARRSLRAQRVDAGRPQRYEVTLGTHGLTLRLADVSREIAWDDIVAVTAGFADPSQGRRVSQPVIRVATANSDTTAAAKTLSFRIPIDALDVAPQMLYTALRHYWHKPGARGELGTTTAQHRLEAWARA